MTAFDSTLHGQGLPRHLLSAALLGAAALSAWATYLSAHQLKERPLQPLSQTGERLAGVLKNDLGKEIAKEYSAIRPADLDTTAPPIPPSETWPAQ